MKILLNRGNIKNAKSYPDKYWDELIELLKDHEIREIKGILTTTQLTELVNWADVIITIDTFLPHMIKYYGIKKKVIVLWGLSDPLIFGYPENTNLLKDRKYLRPQQFLWWRDVPCIKEAFVSPEIILQNL